MILGFKTYFPWGEPTNFVHKILSAGRETHCFAIGSVETFIPKLHTIRTGQRWKAGDVLHMAIGVRTKKYDQFNRDIEELSKCRAVQRFDLTIRHEGCAALYIDKKLMYCRNRDHVFEITPGWMEQFSRNDGFTNSEQFFRWFKQSVRNGQIIHWTDLKY